jgi:hypothetical protein
VARKVLLDVDADQLEQFDRFWREAGFASRRAAVRHVMHVAVAQHHAHKARNREQRADPNRWLPRDRDQEDGVGGARPLTYRLMDGS